MAHTFYLRIACWLLLALLLAFPLPAQAQTAPTIYVLTSGSNTNCNGTVNLPDSPANRPNCAVSTIAQGIALVASGGTVVVGPGGWGTLIPSGDQSCNLPAP